MQQAGYHHAHMLAQQLKTDLERRDTELFSIIQSVAESTSSSPSVAPTKVSTISASHQHVNATQTDPVQLKMLKILQQMQQTMLSGANIQQTTNTESTTQQSRQPPRKHQTMRHTQGRSPIFTVGPTAAAIIPQHSATVRHQDIKILQPLRTKRED